MKVLQTLGRHAGHQEGIFQYRRTCEGVHIDASVGQANLNPNSIVITHQEWAQILLALCTAEQESFRITGQAPFPVPPNQSLYQLFEDSLPNPVNGWQWNDSWKAYVTAVLEHEGSVDLYHGPLGQNHTAIITLSRDTTP